MAQDLHCPSENDKLFAQTLQGQSKNEGLMHQKSKDQRSQGHSENDELLAQKFRAREMESYSRKNRKV